MDTWEPRLPEAAPQNANTQTSKLALNMSVDKRTLDDLDALFRAVPAKAASRPAKKLRSVGTPAVAPSSSGAKRGAVQSTAVGSPPLVHFFLHSSSDGAFGSFAAFVAAACALS